MQRITLRCEGLPVGKLRVPSRVSRRRSMASFNVWNEGRRPSAIISRSIQVGVVLALCWMVVSPSAAETWKAGVAKRAITPSTPMWMSGYASRDHPAEGKLTELWAKALCCLGSRLILSLRSSFKKWK